MDRLTRVLLPGLGDRAVVAVQNPGVLGDLSEPQPILAVLRPRADIYAAAHPAPAVEVGLHPAGDLYQRVGPAVVGMTIASAAFPD